MWYMEKVESKKYVLEFMFHSPFSRKKCGLIFYSNFVLCSFFYKVEVKTSGYMNIEAVDIEGNVFDQVERKF